MTKRVHTILCWILAISLTWLPFSVSADFSSSQTENEPCHEMSSDRVVRGITTVSDELVLMALPVEKSMKLKGCCDQCDNNCTCTGMTSCVHSTNHVPSIIAFNKYFTQSLQFTQSSIESSARYHSRIVTPDFRPPIV